MGPHHSQALDQAGMAGQLVRAMLDGAATEAVRFETLIKLKWLVASSAVESVHLRQLVYHTPGGATDEGANLFFAAVYSLARSLHLVTAAERAEFVAFLVTRFSELDAENEVQIASGLHHCVLTLLSFGLQQCGKVTGATPFPLGLVLQLVEMYARYPAFALAVAEGPGRHYLTRLLGAEADLPTKASAAASLVKLGRIHRLPLMMEPQYRPLLAAMLGSTLEQKAAAAELAAIFVEHAASHAMALRNADALLECDIVSSLVSALEEQYPNVVAAQHPEVLCRVLDCLAAVAHALAALTTSDAAVARLMQDIAPLLQCLTAVNQADPETLAAAMPDWQGDPNEGYLKCKFFLALVLCRMSQLHMTQDLMVSKGAMSVLLMSLESRRSISPVVRDTNANLLRALRHLGQSHPHCRAALIQDPLLPNLLDCLVIPGRPNTTDALYVLEAILPVPLDYVDHSVLSLLTQALGGAMTQALCWVLGPLLSTPALTVEDRHAMKLTVDGLLRLCHHNPDLRTWLWEQVPLRELKEFLELCGDLELSLLVAQLVKALFEVPGYQERMQAVGLLDVIRSVEDTALSPTPALTFSSPAARTAGAPRAAPAALAPPPTMWPAPAPAPASVATVGAARQPWLPPASVAPLNATGPALYNPNPMSPSYQSPLMATHSQWQAPAYHAHHGYSSPAGTGAMSAPLQDLTLVPPPSQELTPEQLAAVKIQEFYRNKFNAQPENWRRLRMALYSDAIFEKLQLHEKTARELTALYVSHKSYVASLAPIRVAGVLLQPSRPNVDTAEQAASVALWRKLHAQGTVDEAQLAVLAELTPAMGQLDYTPEPVLDEGERLFYSGMATKVQRVWRGYHCRQALLAALAPYRRLMRQPPPPRHWRVPAEMLAVYRAATLVIQRRWRGVLGRNAVWRAISAAIVVQTQWRMYLLRRPPRPIAPHTTVNCRPQRPATPPPPRAFPKPEPVPAPSPTAPTPQQARPAPPRPLSAEEAAVRIQRAWRQRCAQRRQQRRRRQRAEARRTPEQRALRTAAALVLQRCQRGKWGRDEARRRRAVVVAQRRVAELYPDPRAQQAVQLQRIVRGHLARKRARQCLVARHPITAATDRHRRAEELRLFRQSLVGQRWGRLRGIDRREANRRAREEERRQVRQARWRAAGRQRALQAAEQRARDFEAAERRRRLLAGLTVQRAWRGVVARRGAQRSRAAALRIQRLWRGYCVRRKLWREEPPASTAAALPTLTELTSLSFMQPRLPAGVAPPPPRPARPPAVPPPPAPAPAPAPSVAPARPARPPPPPPSVAAAPAAATASLVASGLPHPHAPHGPEGSANCAFCRMWRERGEQTREQRQSERRAKKRAAQQTAAAPLVPWPVEWWPKPPSPEVPADQRGGKAPGSPTAPARKALAPLPHAPAAPPTPPDPDPLAAVPRRPGSLPALRHEPPPAANLHPAAFDHTFSTLGAQSMMDLYGTAPLQQSGEFPALATLTATGDLQSFERALIAMHEELQKTQRTLEDRLMLTQAKQDELIRQQQQMLDNWSETVSRCSTRPGSAIAAHRPGSAPLRDSAAWARPMSAGEFRQALADVLAASAAEARSAPGSPTKVQSPTSAVTPNATLRSEAQTQLLRAEENAQRQALEWQMWQTLQAGLPSPVGTRHSTPSTPSKPRPFSPRHAQLERLLADDPSLTTLDLSGGDLTDAAALPFIAPLPTNTHLLELTLDHNRLGDATALALAAALGKGGALRRLSLRSNSVSPAGAAALLDVLARSPTLREVRLLGNDASGTTLQELLRRFPTVAVTTDQTLLRR